MKQDSVLAETEKSFFFKRKITGSTIILLESAQGGLTP